MYIVYNFIYIFLFRKYYRIFVIYIATQILHPKINKYFSHFRILTPRVCESSGAECEGPCWISAVNGGSQPCSLALCALSRIMLSTTEPVQLLYYHLLLHHRIQRAIIDTWWVNIVRVVEHQQTGKSVTTLNSFTVLYIIIAIEIYKNSNLLLQCFFVLTESYQSASNPTQ